MRVVRSILALFSAAAGIATPLPAQVRIAVEAPRAVIAGTEEVVVTFRLTTEAGDPLPPPGEVTFTATASGSGSFGAAVTGTVLSQPEPGTIEVRSDGGVVALHLAGTAGETVAIGIIDSAGAGATLSGDIRDDFEVDSPDWTHGIVTGLADDWSISTARAASGTRSWYAGDPAPDTSSAELVSPVLELASGTGARLEFLQWYLFEDGSAGNFPDGGVVEARVHPGGSWTRLEPEGGYPASLNAPCENPIGQSSPAFTGTTGDVFVPAAFDLSVYGGTSIQVRFLAGWDCGNIIMRESWYIDDFRISGLSPTIAFYEGSGDADGDGLSNADEIARGTDPARTDTDGDGLQDPVETDTGVFAGAGDSGTDPLLPDTDGDGLTDGGEVAAGLNPVLADTDGDGLVDGVETGTGTFVDAGDTGTDPLLPDTDGDGRTDGAEVAAGLNPVLADTDGDGLRDGVETGTGVFVDAGDTGTDPLDPDTDDGGRYDGSEVARGLDPLDSTDDSIARILAWLRYTDLRYAWINVQQTLLSQTTAVVIDETIATDPAQIEEELTGKDIFLYPHQYDWDGSFDQGAAFSGVIREFVDRGGVVIALGATGPDFTRGAGLLDASPWNYLGGGYELRRADPLHFLLEGVTDPVLTEYPTYAYQVADPEAETVLTFDYEGSGHPIVAVKALGKGGVILLGFDYSQTLQYGENVARILGNAVEGIVYFVDSDGDGIPDTIEERYGLDPLDPADAGGDPDGDGLTNLEEHRARTDFRSPDTDADGLGDAVEVRVAGTDPRNPDTDSDLLLDGVETGTGVFAGPSDTGTDPLQADTDGGGRPDGDEVARGLDPNGPTDDAVTRILAWVYTADRFGEYPQTLDAIRRFNTSFTVTESVATEASVLEAELRGKNVFLIPEQEMSLSSTTAQGQKFAAVLQDFVSRGGLVIALFYQAGGLVRGAGLADVAMASDGTFGEGVALRVDLPDHFLARGLTAAVGSMSATHCWIFRDTDFEVVLSRASDGSPVAGVRSFGGGGVILIGFDYYAFDDNGARLIANAVDGGAFFIDTDADGIPDRSELLLGLDPEDPADGAADIDGDGLTNLAEFLARTDPRIADTDGDGLSDGAEVGTTHTDPRKPDTDGDGLRDNVETGTGVFVGLNDTGSDPLRVDTDGGGRGDGDEVILGQSPVDPADDGVTRVLAWVVHVDRTWEYPNTLAAINRFATAIAIQESVATDPAVLAGELETKDVLLFPEQENWTEGFAQGQAFAAVLQEFVSRGGVVVAMFTESGNLVRGAGLIDATSGGTISSSTPLHVDLPDHFLARGLSSSVVSQDATNLWTIGGEDVENVVVRASDGARIVAVRAIDAGGVILLGFDYYSYSDDTAHLLANAIDGRFHFLDSDGDGISNRMEIILGLDPADPEDGAGDLDADGLSNVNEIRARTNPRNPDTDGDSLLDGAEVVAGTDPLRSDTDLDGLKDGVETDTGTYVGPSDTGTDPLLPDTDGGGRNDGDEVARKLNPVDPADDGVTEILAWVYRADKSREYPNALEAIRRFAPAIEVTESQTLEPEVLSAELAGKDVFLIPEQEGWTGGSAQGQKFAPVLQDFVSRGGIVVALHSAAGDLVRGAGLMNATSSETFGSGAALTIRLPDHHLARGLTPPVSSQDGANTWVLQDPDVEIVLTRTIDGAPIAAVRPFLAGAVFLLGFDCYNFDDNLARLLANSVEGAIYISDADEDGIPDRCEGPLGLDPEDPADASQDPDGDGLTNLEEFHGRTDLRSADTDGDGLSDGDEVKVAGTDPLRPDTDGDGLADGTDPFPAFIARVEIRAPYAGLTTEPAILTCRLVDPAGAPLSPPPTRFTLTATGGARFGEAVVGTIVSGGGTSQVLVETSDGVVEIPISDSISEEVVVDVVDSENKGISLVLSDFVKDFEADDGGFIHGGSNDPWQWGIPTSGPGRAYSGTKVWATNLAGNYPNSVNCQLDGPPIDLPPGISPRLSFRHYYSGECCCDTAWIQFSLDGGNFADLPGITGNSGNRFYCNATNDDYQEVTADLSAYAGKTIQIRFRFTGDGSGTGPGWYVDDFKLTGIRAPTRLFFIDPEGDMDGDGLTNRGEFEAGTDPTRADTDRDGLSDAAETGTGTFVDVENTGTDPIGADTDGDGTSDGDEVASGTYPGDPDSVPAASSFDFSSMLPSTAMVMRGNGRQDLTAGTVVLTDSLVAQVGSAFLAAPVNAGEFEASFDFKISQMGGDIGWGADGIALAVVGAPSPAILGEAGGGVGIGGLPYRTLAVVFDTWQNPTDVDDNHVEIRYHPIRVPSGDPPTPLAVTSLPFYLKDEVVHKAVVTMKAGRITVAVSYYEGEPPETVLSLAVPGFTPFTGYLGFTASTGSAWERHEIDNLTVSSRFLAVTGVSPASGPSGGGTELTVTGMGFVAGSTRVTIGGAEASDLVVLDEQTLRFAAPPHATGRCAVQVFLPSFTAGKAAAFTYTPFVSTALPSYGLQAGGGEVLLRGLGFLPDSTVRFGDAEAPGAVVVNPTTVRVTAPPGTGTVGVTVTNADGTNTRVAAFRYLAPDDDTDGDGLTDGVEILHGTGALDRDSDDDGLLDGVETDTGIFSGPGDTGTDPLVADTDEGGVRDGDEVTGGTSPLNPVDDLKAGTLPTVIADGTGFRWDFQSDGSAGDGTDDAFDGALYLRVNDVQFPSSSSNTVLTDPRGEIVAIGPVALAGLQVSRSLFVPRSGGGFARYREVLANSGATAISARVTIRGNLGPWNTTVQASSSGDKVFAPGDDWFVADEGPGAYPAVAFVVAGRFGLVTPSAASISSDSFEWSYDVVVPPEKTVEVLHFAVQSSTSAAAEETARALAALDGRAREGLSATILDRTVNFGRDTDSDGIPDPVERDLGLDPADPNDADSDLDGDGLSNIDEFRIGTGIADADSDDDGLQDGAEVAAGADPKNVDSDGDGVRDGGDPYPGFSIAVSYSGPALAVARSPVAFRAELRGEAGALLAGRTLRFALRVTEGAVFSESAVEGRVVTGASTDRIVVETDTGAVSIDVIPSVAGTFDVSAEDSEPIGLQGRIPPLVFYRVNCGCGVPYTDLQGREWSADAYCAEGETYEWFDVFVDGTDDPTIYRTERYGLAAALNYSFPIAAGSYVVALHFAEMWDGAPGENRLVSVDIEGQRVLTDFNLIGELGYRVAGVRSFEAEVEDGTLDISVAPGSWGHQNPKISAIEVLREETIPEKHRIVVLEPEGDEDADGSTNARELALGTDPYQSDTDGDGLRDGVETGTGTFVGLGDTGTDPLLADSDADGVIDGLEARAGSDPNQATSVFPEFAGDILLAGSLIEVGLKSDGTLITSARRGILLKKGLGGSIPDFLAPSTAHELFSLRYLEGGSARTYVNGISGKHVTFRNFNGSSNGELVAIGVGDAGLLSVRQETRLGMEDQYVRFRVTLTNSGPAQLRTIKYLRNVNTTIDAPATSNDVLRPGVAIATGTSGQSLIIGSDHPNATASVEGKKFSDPDLVILSPEDPDGVLGDISQNLAFLLGDLDPGESRTFEFVYAPGISARDADLAYLSSTDTDDDGIPDAMEIEADLDPQDPSDAGGDVDGDGLSNLQEYLGGTGIANADSDGDGLGDGAEIAAQVDPLEPDSDGDFLLDGEEFPMFGTRPEDPDLDLDGYPDGIEFVFGGDPRAADVLPRIPDGVSFASLPTLEDLQGFASGGFVKLDAGTIRLPDEKRGTVGTLFSTDPVSGEFLYVAVDFQFFPGTSGHSHGLVVALVDAPSPQNLVGDCCQGLGIGGLPYPTLAIELDLTSQSGDPAGYHIGIGHYPTGVPSSASQANACLVTQSLPLDPVTGGTLRLEIEVLGSWVRTYLSPVVGGGGAAGDRQPVVSCRVPDFAGIRGYVGVVGSSSSAYGSQALRSLAIASHGAIDAADIVPDFGGMAGGAVSTVRGTGFAEGAEVFVGQSRAEVLSVSPEEIVITIPAAAAVGPRDVHVLGAGGGDVLRDGFTYTPFLRGISPATGPRQGGFVVLLIGSGFVAGDLPRVFLGGQEAVRVTFVSESILQVEAPPGEGVVDVVTDSGGVRSVLRRAFTYVPALMVPSGVATIQEAVNAAGFDGMIVVGPGRYIGEVNLRGKSVELRSLAGPGSTVLAGSGLGTPVVRVEAGGRAVLRGFTIEGGGGGIAVDDGARATLLDLVVRGNDGPDGRGITIGQDVVFEIDRTIVTDNRCRSGSGGGIIVGPRSNGRIADSVIARNIASRSGGGIALFDEPAGQVTLTHLTVVGNRAGENGGGIRLSSSGSAVLLNSVLWDNEGYGLGPDLFGGTMAAVMSCDAEAHPFLGENGNFSADPLFRDPAAGDYSLREDSPLIEVGTPGGAAGLVLDVAGLVRLADADGDGTSLPDLGAYEALLFAPTFRRGDAEADGRLNITDPLMILTFLFLGGEQPACLDAADADDDGMVSIGDGIYLLEWLFLGADEPPAPGPRRCGPDPTRDVRSGKDLGCEPVAPCR